MIPFWYQGSKIGHMRIVWGNERAMRGSERAVRRSEREWEGGVRRTQKSHVKYSHYLDWYMRLLSCSLSHPLNSPSQPNHHLSPLKLNSLHCADSRDVSHISLLSPSHTSLSLLLTPSQIPLNSLSLPLTALSFPQTILIWPILVPWFQKGIICLY